MSHARPVGILAGIVAGTVVVLTGILPTHGFAQSGGAIVYPDTVEQSGTAATVDVMAAGVKNLGAFQMVVSWDPSILTFVDITDGGFLGASGRRPICPDPVKDASAVRFACVTVVPVPTGDAANATRVAVPGVDGTGALARLQFRVLSAGDAKLHLSRVKLVDPDGTEIQSSTSDGEAVRVSSANGGSHIGLIVGASLGAIVALLACAGVASLVLRRRSGSPATPPEDPPTV